MLKISSGTKERTSSTNCRADSIAIEAKNRGNVVSVLISGKEHASYHTGDCNDFIRSIERTGSAEIEAGHLFNMFVKLLTNKNFQMTDKQHATILALCYANIARRD